MEPLTDDHGAHPLMHGGQGCRTRRRRDTWPISFAQCAQDRCYSMKWRQGRPPGVPPQSIGSPSCLLLPHHRLPYCVVPLLRRCTTWECRQPSLGSADSPRRPSCWAPFLTVAGAPQSSNYYAFSPVNSGHGVQVLQRHSEKLLSVQGLHRQVRAAPRERQHQLGHLH